jgi:hypothetical protein
MEISYPIDLQTILRILAQQSGELYTNVKNVNAVRGECRASVVLLEGKIISCEIQQDKRVVLSGKEALQLLLKKGILEWKYVPRASSPPANPNANDGRQYSPTQYSPIQYSPINDGRQYSPINDGRQYSPSSSFYSGTNDATAIFPVRARPISQQEFSTWSRTLRSVYNLVTGDKSVWDIAVLLSAPPDRLMSTLQELVNMNAINLLRSPRKP